MVNVLPEPVCAFEGGEGHPVGSRQPARARKERIKRTIKMLQRDGTCDELPHLAVGEDGRVVAGEAVLHYWAADEAEEPLLGHTLPRHRVEGEILGLGIARERQAPTALGSGNGGGSRQSGHPHCANRASVSKGATRRLRSVWPLHSTHLGGHVHAGVGG